jgi:hypothetical protein
MDNGCVCDLLLADDQSSPQYLRESLREQLKPGGGGFTFALMAQRQTDPCLQPLENARVPWPRYASKTPSRPLVCVFQHAFF